MSILSTSKTAIVNISNKFKARAGIASSSVTDAKALKSKIAGVESGLRFDVGALQGILERSQAYDSNQCVTKTNMAAQKAVFAMACVTQSIKALEELQVLMGIAEQSVKNTAAII
jgi:hypothetical protein